MKILVTGSKGYIGSFMSRHLVQGGNEVIGVDSKGDEVEQGFFKGDLRNKDFIHGIFEKNEIDAVMHFAAFISMGESMADPGKYFENNVQACVNLLDEMSKRKIHKFIFSSTAGVYGNPNIIPILEDHEKNPSNPYGQSKLIVEDILKWYERIFNIRYCTLRYFNAAGASLDGLYGENHEPETHLIPNVINSVLRGTEFSLYGDNYDTKDGTCVRDYIHVLDLVMAHELALDYLNLDSNISNTFNVGTGKGFSNMEVIKMVEKISGKNVKIKKSSKRSGDANILIADSNKIKKELGFIPKYSDLETIVESAWKWHSSHLSE